MITIKISSYIPISLPSLGQPTSFSILDSVPVYHLTLKTIHQPRTPPPVIPSILRFLHSYILFGFSLSLIPLTATVLSRPLVFTLSTTVIP